MKVVVASDGGDGEGGVEMMPTAGRRWLKQRWLPEKRGRMGVGGYAKNEGPTTANITTTITNGDAKSGNISRNNIPDRDEGGGDDVDGSVVVASDGGDGEGGVEIDADGWSELDGRWMERRLEKEKDVMGFVLVLTIFARYFGHLMLVFEVLGQIKKLSGMLFYIKLL
ncbi:hypothetical protein Tco_0967905 [Tanacetum coccineum]